MPQVTGNSLAAAQSALRQAGLIPGKVVNQASTTIQAGIVISTTPAAGLAWPVNKPVTLVVSSGQPVPSFVGQQKAVAEQWAAANGVSLNEVTVKSSQPAGTVVQQSVLVRLVQPAPGHHHRDLQRAAHGRRAERGRPAGQPG